MKQIILTATLTACATLIYKHFNNTSTVVSLPHVTHEDICATCDEDEVITITYFDNSATKENSLIAGGAPPFNIFQTTKKEYCEKWAAPGGTIFREQPNTAPSFDPTSLISYD